MAAVESRGALRTRMQGRAEPATPCHVGFFPCPDRPPVDEWYASIAPKWILNHPDHTGIVEFLRFDPEPERSSRILFPRTYSMTRIARSLIVAVVLGLASGCADTAPTTVGGPEEDARPSASPLVSGGAGLPVYGLGGFTRATPGEPCSGPMHRRFDFWLGEWDVFNPHGNQVGTNVVVSELDGCVVSEHWVGTGGIPGRSINTFDSETGEWHQTWVSAAFSQHLRMAGGVDSEGRMVLAGRRDAVGRGFSLFNEFTWTALGPNRVEQIGILRLPAFDIENSFVGIYERTGQVTPAPAVPAVGCQPGGLESQSIVLTGMEQGPGAGGELFVRPSLSPHGPDRVLQGFEVSREGGETWSEAVELVYERR